MNKRVFPAALLDMQRYAAISNCSERLVDEKNLTRRQAETSDAQPVSRALAAALASGAFIVPLAMSASSSPSPNHPRVMAWYFSLRKPWFKPPDWLIPIAWAGIEAAYATAAYRLLRAAPSGARQRALMLLSWNVFTIGAWSQLFFKHRSLGASTVAASAMIATGAEYVRQSKAVDRQAARLGSPFVVWVSIATVLTAAIWGLNRRRK
jgi:tryptophan-rich sensory protein